MKEFVNATRYAFHIKINVNGLNTTAALRLVLYTRVLKLTSFLFIVQSRENRQSSFLCVQTQWIKHFITFVHTSGSCALRTISVLMMLFFFFK